MLDAAKRNIADARQTAISQETRLDAAYRAIMQASMVALWANGFRPARNAPGHHMTMIQSLTHTVSLHQDQVLMLDTFRVKRNAIDYTGGDADEASVEACAEAASSLLQHLTAWLAEHRSELLTLTN